MSNPDVPAEQPVVSRLWPASAGVGQGIRRSTGVLAVAATAFLVVTGIGAATSYFGSPQELSRVARSGSQDEAISRLEDYTRAIETKEAPASKAKGGELLPDVGTMIERLAARLETSPDDLKGWRMLGWSYYYMGRHKEAAAAYARAVALDPNSAELKTEYEEAMAKASESDGRALAPHPHGKPAARGGGEPSAEQVASFQAMPPHERESAIRAMVDGLAARLESAPRDAEGWTRLMRSRVVLGERDVAAAAFRKALDVFKDDAAASARIAAAATELGLKTE